MGNSGLREVDCIQLGVCLFDGTCSLKYKLKGFKKAKDFFQNMNSVYRTPNAELIHQMDDKEIGSFD